jgi:hypothetical protein
MFLLGLLAVALVTGLVFKDRAFCRGFCPVGQLLATYGRGGMLAIRAGSAENCGACTGKDRLLACNRNRLDARSCPSLLNPPKLNSNRDCLVCGQCIKSCQPDNMRLLLRRPFHPSDAREPLASWPTTLFVMLVSGFVTWELFAEWPKGEEVFLAVPHWVSTTVATPWLAGYLNGMWALVIVPLVIWIFMGGRPRVRGRFHYRRDVAPSGVARGGCGRGRAYDTMVQPILLLPLAVVAVLGIVLILGGLVFAIREARLAHPNRAPHVSYLIPKISLALAFVLVVVGWAFK